MPDQYFEMLWDCTQCGARGLFAKSQRHCPSCGTAQDPAKRYFPKPGQEKQATGHQFVGADWRCSYCESPNSAAAAFCGNCGGPKEGAQKVQPIVEDGPGGALADITVSASEVPTPSGSAIPARTGSKSWPWRTGLAALLLVTISVLVLLFMRKHDETVQVIEKTWSREVDVERFSAVSASDWCDALPANAYQVSRRQEQRSTRQIEVGQDCRDIRVDMGDGTFTKRSECTPRFRSEPVFDAKCSYRIDRWQVLRTARLDGGANLAPTWPTPLFGNTGVLGDRLGAERIGSQREHYSVRLQSTEGKDWTCNFDFARWSALQAQQTLTVKVRAIGGVDCDSLGKPER
ncbi:MAG: zinc ribbon domain-containing protein [Rhodoferax sp.]|nr:zinc ribbon domain-containing protein [Rhodoferax sp.]